jgi:predicted nucleotidyltransferase
MWYDDKGETMKSNEEILKTMKKELPYLKEKFKVKSIGIFCSYARGEQTKKSDIDMLVEFDAPVGFFKFIELEDYLSEMLGVKVDLVTPDALKPLIKLHIIEEAVYA